jgi:hypothetical protein
MQVPVIESQLGMLSMSELVKVILLSLLSLPLFADARHQPLEMDEYVRTFETLGYGDGSMLHAVNLYRSPLAAMSWEYQCENVSFKKITGYLDAALEYSSAIATGADSGALVDTRTCSGRLTALVFADGKEVGSETALKQIYNRRAFAYGELHDFLTRDLLGKPLIEWNPGRSISALQARSDLLQRPYEHSEEIIVRAAIVLRLTTLIQELEDASKDDHHDQLLRRHQFVVDITNWDANLISNTFSRNKRTFSETHS